MQTGTGKTHTMDGGHGDTERGIIPKAFGHIFDAIQVSLKCATVRQAGSRVRHLACTVSRGLQLASAPLMGLARTA